MELDPSPISGIGSNTNSRPVSSHGPPMSEAETEEMRMKKEGEKILSELPPSIIAPGPSQWEIDVSPFTYKVNSSTSPVSYNVWGIKC